jgi:hypothetical protein
MKGRRPAARPLTRGRAARTAFGGAAALLALSTLAGPTLAEEAIAPSNAVSSSGGVATAEGSSSVTTGDIVTGLNTGHSVQSGGATNGDVIVTVAEMSSAADLEVVAEVGSQIADASGGDNGESSSTPGPQGPDITVDVDNSDKNRNDNRSNATGIGEGGEGGEGGDGGDVIINPPPDGGGG